MYCNGKITELLASKLT